MRKIKLVKTAKFQYKLCSELNEEIVSLRFNTPKLAVDWAKNYLTSFSGVYLSVEI